MQCWGRRREVGAGVERQRQRGGRRTVGTVTRVQCSNIAARQLLSSRAAWPAASQHCANIMEAFGDESYVGIKEITMDMKVKLHFFREIVMSM